MFKKLMVGIFTIVLVCSMFSSQAFAADNGQTVVKFSPHGSILPANITPGLEVYDSDGISIIEVTIDSEDTFYCEPYGEKFYDFGFAMTNELGFHTIIVSVTDNKGNVSGFYKKLQIVPIVEIDINDAVISTYERDEYDKYVLNKQPIDLQESSIEDAVFPIMKIAEIVFDDFAATDSDKIMIQVSPESSISIDLNTDKITAADEFSEMTCKQKVTFKNDQAYVKYLQLLKVFEFFGYSVEEHSGIVTISID